MALIGKPKILVIFGLISLLHAAYSAAQHRSYLRLTEQEFSSLPLDIVLQSITSLIITMLGVVYVAGEFKEIRATVDFQRKTWEAVGNRPSFYTFNHRGKALSPNYNPPKNKAMLEE